MTAAPATARPVRIAASGLVCALGSGRAGVATRLLAGETGLGPLAGIPSPLAGRLPVSQVAAADLPPGTGESATRCEAMARAALHQALDEAHLWPGHPALAGAALLVATITGDAERSEVRYREQVARHGPVPCVTVEPPAGRLATRLAASLGVGGPVLTVSSACTSAMNALLAATHLIRSGRVPRALVVGADALTATLVHGFEALLLLDPDGCRPFDATRRGIQPGEGAAALLLEPDGGLPGPRILGGASRCDPHHLTASSPDGSGAEAVLRATCARAGVAPSSLAAVRAHGTGTPDNDAAEGQGLRRLFGDAVPPLASLKRALGHTMGASGAVECVALLGCLEAGAFPACAGFVEADPAVGVTPLRSPLPFTDGDILLDTFGFGGNSVGLVLRWGRP